MEFGLTWAKINEMEYVTRAEDAGYTHLWVTDSGLIRSDSFAMMTLAAMTTKHMTVGTGVAVPGLRLAPVLAGGVATVNRIAPGRVFCAMGTGNTGMRMLGRKPMRLKDFEQYARTVKGLLTDGEADYPNQANQANQANQDKPHKIRFMLTDKGYVNIKDPIPLILAGYGPKAQALAGEIADGLTTAIPRAGDLDSIWANVKTGAARSGRSLENFHLSVRLNIAVLEKGEAVTSDRIVDEFGPAIMTAVHSTMDRHLEYGEDPPDFLKPIWKDYLAFHMSRPADKRQQMMHESHNAYVAADERRFVTEEMIRKFCVVGDPGAIVEQLKEMERRGVKQLMCNFPLERGYQMVQDYSRNIIRRM